MDKMTVARALVELKSLKKRIEKLTHQFMPVVMVAGDKLPAGIKSKEDFAATTKAEFQQLSDLIRRRRLIKGAVVKSNALVQVTIAGMAMTVAEAIERKTSIEAEKELLKVIRERVATTVKGVEKQNEEVQRRLDQLLTAALSGKESQRESRDIEAISKPFLAKNEARMEDPLDIAKVIRRMEDEINEFTAEVDIALTESNARVDIEV